MADLDTIQTVEALAGDKYVHGFVTDIEQELAAVFGIQSIPTLLFIDANGEPMLQPGAFPKHVFKKVIEDKLLLPAKMGDS